MAVIIACAQLLALEAFTRFHDDFDVLWATHARSPGGRVETPAGGHSIEVGEGGGLPPIPSSDAPLAFADELGFRTWAVDYDHPRGERVMFMGGYSMARGNGVWVHEAFPHVFWRRFLELYPGEAIEVVNANRPALSIGDTLPSIGPDGFERIDPALVVLSIANPVASGARRRRGEVLTSRVFSYESGGAARAHVQWQAFGARATLEAGSILAARLFARVDSILSPPPAVGSEVDLRYLDDLCAFLRSRGTGVLAVLLPTPGRIAMHAGMFELIEARLRSLAVPTLRYTPEPSHPLTTVSGAHYSVESHERIGAAITRFVSDTLGSSTHWRRPVRTGDTGGHGPK